MADVVNRTESGRARKVKGTQTGNGTEEAKGPQPVVEAIDDHGAPAGEDEEEVTETEVITDSGAEVVVRKRPLYKRPVFLAVAAVVLIVGAILGLRSWIYA